MSEFDKMLEDVAREWYVEGCGNDECDLPGEECLGGYIKRRLLPLLEAGEKCARAHGVAMENEFSCSSEEEEVWDAAKQAAMEGRS